MAPSVFQQVLDYANRADPYPLYAELRRTPVIREDDGRYVVSTYREIVALLHDPRVSSVRKESEEPPSFIRLDPPEHDRIRRVLNRHFGPPETPGRIDGMRPELLEIVTELIDRFAGKDQVDMVDEFAYPFPVTVICRLLGVPREDEPRFRVWADAVVEAIGPVGAEQERLYAKRDAAIVELRAYLSGLIEFHRRHPRDDLLSALATDDAVLGRMSRAELASNAALLLIAGHETTVNLITNGMLTLLRHPHVLERIRQRPELVIRTVEELLRYEPPVQILPDRVALDDIEIAGTVIPAGAPITLVLAAGSRDPDHVWDPDRFNPERIDPERFVLRRGGNQHLGFGGGVHYCFGAPLARVETQVALSELVSRLDNPRLLADPPPYRPNAVLRGPRHLMVGFDQVRPARVGRVPRAREEAAARAAAEAAAAKERS
ncbi:cytochrome P450 [Actinopolymorpha alba]|uniref:cytochrome P450 n=1 Tax=Actinopolymorpha alba TaxID=533267 RepID=UPI000379236E|nr:cytochrome P450 [Actinopolymorpha alba]